MVPALALILTFQLAGEVISRAGALPVPGPVVGMVMLTAALRASPALMTLLRPAGQGLLAHLSLFFVPAGVGVVAHLPLLARHGAGLALALAASTVLALVAGAVAFTAVARITGNRDE